MSLAQHRSITKAFTCSQFGYCPLLWMFQSRKMNNPINSLLKHILRVVYRDCNVAFLELLRINKSVTIQQNNLQLLEKEIFKQKKLNPKFMEQIITLKNVDCSLRSNTSLKIGISNLVTNECSSMLQILVLTDR